MRPGKIPFLGEMHDEPKRRDWTLRGRLMRRRAIKSMDLKKLCARTKNCVATRSKPKLHTINRHGKHGGRHQDNCCSTDTRNTRRLSFSGPHLRSREEHDHDILFVERS